MGIPTTLPLRMARAACSIVERLGWDGLIRHVTVTPQFYYDLKRSAHKQSASEQFESTVSFGCGLEAEGRWRQRRKAPLLDSRGSESSCAARNRMAGGSSGEKYRSFTVAALNRSAFTRVP